VNARWLFALPLIAGAVAAQPDVDPAFARHGVVALGYTSPAFRQSLVQLIGEENARVCERVLPETLILWNSSPSPVSMVVLRYPDSIVVLRLADLSVSLGPGEALVVPPDTSLTQALHFARLGRQSPISPQRVMGWLQQGPTPGQRPLSLDSVVFADGGVAGPDRTDVIVMERDREAAESEIIRHAQDASLSDADFSKWLEEVGRSPLIASDIRQTNLYGIALARAMLSRLRLPRAGGRTSVAPTLEGAQKRRVPSPSGLHKLD
jgi:hypothetical protein